MRFVFGDEGRRPARLALAVAATIATSSAVVLGAWVRDASSEEWSGASGPAGSQKQELSASSDYHALRSFKFWEYDRRPCVIEVGQVSLNAESVTALGKLRVCEPNMTEAWKAVDIGSGRYVSALQVCTEKPADGVSPRLRGARFWGVTIEPDGTVKAKGAPASFELPDCKKWHEKKSCPKGKVATGIRGWFDDAAKGITSLELRCHAPKEQK
jgi:hypothetical protein